MQITNTYQWQRLQERDIPTTQQWKADLQRVVDQTVVHYSFLPSARQTGLQLLRIFGQEVLLHKDQFKQTAFKEHLTTVTKRLLKTLCAVIWYDQPVTTVHTPIPGHIIEQQNGKKQFHTYCVDEQAEAIQKMKHWHQSNEQVKQHLGEIDEVVIHFLLEDKEMILKMNQSAASQTGRSV